MTFARVKPLGWAVNEVLTSSQQNTLDEDHADAIDGVGGGAYTITAALSIDGDNITLGAGTDTVTIGDGPTGNFICNPTAFLQNGLDVVAGGMSVTGDIAINGPIIASGAGRLRLRYHTATNGNISVGPATADVVFTPSGVLSAARDQTVDDTGAANGDVMIFATDEGTHVVTVKNPGGGTIMTIRFVSGSRLSVTVMRIAGTWYPIDVGYVV